MTTQQILNGSKHLSTVELLKVIEVATKQMLVEINTQPLLKRADSRTVAPPPTLARLHI